MKPHPELNPYFDNLTEKQKFLRNVFDSAAPHYDGIAIWGWFNSGHWYRRTAFHRAGLKSDMRVLDVASGTGLTALVICELLDNSQNLTCLEPSRGMINESVKKLPNEHIQGVADKIAIVDNHFDFLSMGFALRHVEDLLGAFREYYRVLKPGGKILIMDVTQPEAKLSRLLFKLYFKHILPFLTKVFTGSQDAHYMMTYYYETMEKMVDPDEVISMLTRAGFMSVKRNTPLGMFSEYTAIKS
jgi:demethylmenaquinone methyltransferase/2-methoxy-6-polyprenyl-1,4-benzoquinol methylase